MSSTFFNKLDESYNELNLINPYEQLNNNDYIFQNEYLSIDEELKLEEQYLRNDLKQIQKQIIKRFTINKPRREQQNFKLNLKNLLLKRICLRVELINSIDDFTDYDLRMIQNMTWELFTTVKSRVCSDNGLLYSDMTPAFIKKILNKESIYENETLIVLELVNLSMIEFPVEILEELSIYQIYNIQKFKYSIDLYLDTSKYKLKEITMPLIKYRYNIIPSVKLINQNIFIYNSVNDNSTSLTIGVILIIEKSNYPLNIPEIIEFNINSNKEKDQIIKYNYEQINQFILFERRIAIIMFDPQYKIENNMNKLLLNQITMKNLKNTKGIGITTTFNKDKYNSATYNIKFESDFIDYMITDIFLFIDLL